MKEELTDNDTVDKKDGALETQNIDVTSNEASHEGNSDHVTSKEEGHDNDNNELAREVEHHEDDENHKLASEGEHNEADANYEVASKDDGHKIESDNDGSEEVSHDTVKEPNTNQPLNNGNVSPPVEVTAISEDMFAPEHGRMSSQITSRVSYQRTINGSKIQA